jgi:hypothetical protein
MTLPCNLGPVLLSLLRVPYSRMQRRSIAPDQTVLVVPPC